MAELRISSPPLSLNGSRRRHVCTNRTVVKLRPRRPLWKTPLHFAATDGMSLTPAPPLRRRPSSPIPALWARWRRSGMSSNSQPGARKRTRSSFLWCVYLSGQSKRARSRGIENAKPVNFQKCHHPRALASPKGPAGETLSRGSHGQLEAGTHALSTHRRSRWIPEWSHTIFSWSTGSPGVAPDVAPGVAGACTRYSTCEICPPFTIPARRPRSRVMPSAALDSAWTCKVVVGDALPRSNGTNIKRRAIIQCRAPPPREELDERLLGAPKPASTFFIAPHELSFVSKTC
jgi:hypothetical protein